MSTRLDPGLITLIRCPVTKSTLAPASTSIIEKLNKQIEARAVVNQIGQTVDLNLDGGFINENRSLLFPIRDEIVILSVDQAICLDPSLLL
jgi:uncharacterized protein YbaR (Trm112 family)